jgi:hypothetical protein
VNARSCSLRAARIFGPVLYSAVTPVLPPFGGFLYRGWAAGLASASPSGGRPTVPDGREALARNGERDTTKAFGSYTNFATDLSEGGSNSAQPNSLFAGKSYLGNCLGAAHVPKAQVRTRVPLRG